MHNIRCVVVNFVIMITVMTDFAGRIAEIDRVRNGTWLLSSPGHILNGNARLLEILRFE